jgi:DNA-binding MarR family transcriptional regulator
LAEDIEEVGGNLRRAVTRLYSRFRSERLEGEVPDAALFVLIALGKEGSMSLTDLADAAHVALGSMSQTVRWLQKLEYVSKSQGTVDRRKVLFELTNDGRTAMSASQRHRRDWLNGRIAELSAGERAALARAAVILQRIADS